MEIINKYLVRASFLFVAVILFSFGVAMAGNAVALNTTNSSQSSNAMLNNSITLAKNFIISKVGVTYFDNYISYKNIHTITYNGVNITYVYFSYNIPFTTNSTTTTGIIVPNLPFLKLNTYVGVINNKNVIYFGPSMPYYISISASNASAYAQSHGLSYNGFTYSYITYGYAQNATNQSGYVVVRAILSNKPQYTSGTYLYGMYLNINNNSILGEYRMSSSVNYYNPVNYILGNFSIFNINQTHLYTANAAANVATPPKYLGNYSTGSTIVYTNTPNEIGMELVLMVIAFGLIGTYIIKNLSK
ncbi:MAG: hypothetical protein M1385_00210 [Candidatus Marsarchaeota archaeon]|nr:hypothetical protein [Candidatus Marsarchaeota archaeon]